MRKRRERKSRSRRAEHSQFSATYLENVFALRGNLLYSPAPRRLAFSLRGGKARIKENMMYRERTKFPRVSVVKASRGRRLGVVSQTRSSKRGSRECLTCVRRNDGSVYGNDEISGGRVSINLARSYDVNGTRRFSPLESKQLKSKPTQLGS